MKRELPIQVSHVNYLSHYGIKKVVAAIGVFDGLHLGHRKIFSELIDMAEEKNASPVIITFSPHPRTILYPNNDLPLIYSPERKAEILKEIGIKAIVTIPFTKEFASLPPEKFVKQYFLSNSVEVLGICVGNNWKFGSKGKGDKDLLFNFSQKYGFAFRAVKEAYLYNKPVSSTEIRKAIANGELEKANKMLGCTYKLRGINNRIYPIRRLNPKKSYYIIELYVEFGILPPLGDYSVKLELKNEQTTFVNAKVISGKKILIYSNEILSNKVIVFQIVNT